MKRLRNVNGNTIYIYKEISFISILDVTTRRQSIANPPMEDSYGRLHMNIDVREIKQVVNILHIYPITMSNPPGESSLSHLLLPETIVTFLSRNLDINRGYVG